MPVRTNRKTKKKYPVENGSGYNAAGGRDYSIFGVKKGDNLKDWDVGLPSRKSPKKKKSKKTGWNIAGEQDDRILS